MFRMPRQRYTEEFKREAVKLAEAAVRKLMQLYGIRARHKRRYKATTDSKHSLPDAPNILNPQFSIFVQYCE